MVPNGVGSRGQAHGVGGLSCRLLRFSFIMSRRERGTGAGKLARAASGCGCSRAGAHPALGPAGTVVVVGGCASTARAAARRALALIPCPWGVGRHWGVSLPRMALDGAALDGAVKGTRAHRPRSKSRKVVSRPVPCGKRTRGQPFQSHCSPPPHSDPPICHFSKRATDGRDDAGAGRASWGM